jgi:hypothetical protein
MRFDQFGAVSFTDLRHLEHGASPYQYACYCEFDAGGGENVWILRTETLVDWG